MLHQRRLAHRGAAFVGIHAADLLQAVHHVRFENAGERHPALLAQDAQGFRGKLRRAVTDRELGCFSERAVGTYGGAAPCQPASTVGLPRRRGELEAARHMDETVTFDIPKSGVVHMLLHVQGLAIGCQPIAVRGVQIAVVMRRPLERSDPRIEIPRRLMPRLKRCTRRRHVPLTPPSHPH